MFINIQALESKSEWEYHYKFNGYPEKNYNFFEENPQYKERGEMSAFLKGHQLFRENFYLSNEQVFCQLQRQREAHQVALALQLLRWHQFV